MRHRKLVRFIKWYLAVSFAVMVAGFVGMGLFGTNDPGPGGVNVWQVVNGIGGACLIFVPILVVMILVSAHYYRYLWHAFDGVFAPLPSPAEVEQQLRSEGYNPSISDVMAVHQGLTSQRNQKAVVGLGALFLLHEANHGKTL